MKYGPNAGRGFERHDTAVVLPDAVEQARDELAALGGVGLGLPEPGEIAEERAAKRRLCVPVSAELRVVADVNVLVSAARSPNGLCGRLLDDATAGRWRPVVSVTSDAAVK